MTKTGNCVNMNSNPLTARLWRKPAASEHRSSDEEKCQHADEINTSDPHEAGGEEAECRAGLYLSAIVNLIADRVAKTHHRRTVNMRGNSHFFI